MNPVLFHAIKLHNLRHHRRNACRRKGIQTGTIDTLIARLCLRHGWMPLTTDKDFEQIARVEPLELWRR